MSTPSITVKEFSPETGSLLSNVSTLGFGKITKGTHSLVKVISLAFGNATSVGNLKLGLIADAGITANSGFQTRYSDGSVDTGHFGIESSSAFDASTASAPLSRHFGGINDTVTSSNLNNVSVGMNSDTVSYYIYLDVETGTSIGSGTGAYKIFFDYS